MGGLQRGLASSRTDGRTDGRSLPLVCVMWYMHDGLEARLRPKWKKWASPVMWYVEHRFAPDSLTFVCVPAKKPATVHAAQLGCPRQPLTLLSRAATCASLNFDVWRSLQHIKFSMIYYTWTTVFWCFTAPAVYIVYAIENSVPRLIDHILWTYLAAAI